MTWNPTAYQTVVESELEEGDPFTENLAKKIGSNEEYLKAQQDLQQNAWSLGSDIWDHFDDLPPSSATSGHFDRDQSGLQVYGHNVANHYLQMTGNLGGDIPRIRTNGQRQFDKVNSVLECRVWIESHSSSTHPFFIGWSTSRTASVGSPGTDAAWFEVGTNSNTFKAKTRSSSTDRVTSDNLGGAAGYGSWVTLKIEGLDASVKFYIDGTLVATHSTSPPVSTPLYAVMNWDGNNGTWMRLDWASYRAIENAVAA